MNLEKLTSKEVISLAKKAEWEKDTRPMPGTMYLGKVPDIAEIDVVKHADEEYKVFVNALVDEDKYEAFFSTQEDAAKVYKVAEEAISRQKHHEGIEKIRSYLERR